MERLVDPLTTIDAKLWADEFMKVKARLGEQEFDHAMMLGWFANAIMQGYDEGQRRAKADAQATVEALQRERDHAKKMEAVQTEVADNQTWHVRELRAALDAEREKVKERNEFIADCDRALDLIQAPRTNDGQEELVSTWRRIELLGGLLQQYRVQLEEHVRTQAELSQLQALVRALQDQLATIEKDLAPINLGTMTSDDMKMFDKTKALVMQTVIARLMRTLDATAPAGQRLTPNEATE